jgi:hemolysin activation/secretion protein
MLSTPPGQKFLQGSASIALAVLMIAPLNAQAQSIPSAPPGAVQPAPPVDLARPSAPIRAPAPPLVIRPGPSAVAPPEAEKVVTTVTSIQLDGVTAYLPGTLEPYYAGLVGHSVPIAALYSAARRIEARYRKEGYVLARVIVPEQAVGDGRFTLRVVEGYVGAVQVSGGSEKSQRLVHRFLDHLTVKQPVRERDLERYLLIANDVPGIATHAVLTPDQGQVGAAALVVEIVEKPVDGYITLDNHGSVFTGPINGAIDVGINDIGGHGGRFEALGFTTFNQEQKYGQLSYQGQVGSEGARLRAYAAYGPSVPGSSLRPLDIHSRSTLFGVAGSYPLIRSRAVSATVNAALEVTNDQQDILGTAFSRDRQRILRLGVLATGVDSRGATTAGVTLHKGLDILDASSNLDAVPQSRADGAVDFFKVTATLSRSQTLVAANSNSLSLFGSLAAQKSASRLLALEQFRVGGDSFGRGYIPGEISGDDGVGASAELQFTGTTPLRSLSHYQLYAFYDYGAARNHGAAWQDLQSAGGGVRVDFLGRFSADFYGAVPFSRGRTEAVGRNRSLHAFFRLNARY